ncbi:MAG: hypothetical protein HUU54_17415 [Ignavibacteriaceae bacterium]|nr:hypothetical protein [Ignavibacteriaceae bacterium]
MRKLSYSLLLFIFATISIFLTGCKDESDPVTPPSEHFEPEGWIVRDATLKPILVVWQGVIQTSWEGNQVIDTLFAPLNALSEHYSVKFLDVNKKILNPPSGADHEFGFAIGDTSIFSIVQDSPTDWAFHLKGKRTGNSTLELQVQHLGHVDVKTPKIPVRTVIDTSAYGEPVGIRLSYEEDATLLVTATSATTTGSLVVTKDSTSDHIKVEFFDENYRFFQPEYPLHMLGITVTDTTIARVFEETGEPWVIRLAGLKQGTTLVIFRLMVGGSAEFTSSSITIQVE